MINFTKLLKVALPVATATTAAIITAYLIAQQHNNLKDLKDQDQLLENIETKPEEFKEEKIEQAQEESEEQSREAKGGDEKDKEAELNEEETKAKEQIEQHLKDNPNKGQLLKELFENPSKLAEKLTLEDKLTESQLKKIASKIEESEKQNTKNQNGDVSTEDEEAITLEDQPEDAGVQDPALSIKERESSKPSEILSEEEQPQGQREETQEGGIPQKSLEQKIPPETSTSEKELQKEEGDTVSQETDIPDLVTKDSKEENPDLVREEGHDAVPSVPAESEMKGEEQASSTDSEGQDSNPKRKPSSSAEEEYTSDLESAGGEKERPEDGQEAGEGSATSMSEELLREMEAVKEKASETINYLQNLLRKTRAG